MEQIQATTIESTKSWYQTWFSRGCRKLVFEGLNRINCASITIEESGEKTLLGNPHSSEKITLVIHDPATFDAFVKGGSIGAAQAYIDGLWSTPDLTAVIRVFAISQQELDNIENQSGWLTQLKNHWYHRRNNNSHRQAKNNILAHYDLGNNLYREFLDPQMMYSAAIYSEEANNLDDAQLLKLKTICQRLELNSNDHLIEIGTGWGGLAIYAAQNYGCKVTTTTISDAQFQYAEQRIKALGLQQQITLLKQDYRELSGQYDKLVSIEMIEAVGHQYFETFFKKCDALVKKGGKMLLQAITIADQRFDHYRNNVDFIQRYIFPGGCLPSVQVLSHHIGRHTNMVIEHLEDIGLHYARTLKDWRQRFETNWPALRTQGFDETFKRMWLYYLCYCEGAFLARATSTVHVLARK